jgi:hypothetical protein
MARPQTNLSGCREIQIYHRKNRYYARVELPNGKNRSAIFYHLEHAIYWSQEAMNLPEEMSNQAVHWSEHIKIEDFPKVDGW